MAACLTSASCVAIDVGHVGCVLHYNIKDLSDAYNASGVTQFLLHRDCLRTSPQPATTATMRTLSTGKIIRKRYIYLICKFLGQFLLLFLL